MNEISVYRLDNLFFHILQLFQQKNIRGNRFFMKHYLKLVCLRSQLPFTHVSHFHFSSLTVIHHLPYYSLSVFHHLSISIAHFFFTNHPCLPFTLRHPSALPPVCLTYLSTLPITHPWPWVTIIHYFPSSITQSPLRTSLFNISSFINLRVPLTSCCPSVC